LKSGLEVELEKQGRGVTSSRVLHTIKIVFSTSAGVALSTITADADALRDQVLFCTKV
jgi:hypothetical protein